MCDENGFSMNVVLNVVFDEKFLMKSDNFIPILMKLHLTPGKTPETPTRPGDSPKKERGAVRNRVRGRRVEVGLREEGRGREGASRRGGEAGRGVREGRGGKGLREGRRGERGLREGGFAKGVLGFANSRRGSEGGCERVGVGWVRGSGGEGGDQGLRPHSEIDNPVASFGEGRRSLYMGAQALDVNWFDARPLGREG